MPAKVPKRGAKNAKLKTKRFVPGTAVASRARTFDELVARATPKVAGTATALRRLVRQAVPGLDENIYGGAKSGLALYSRGSTSNVICGIGPGPVHCLFYVHHAEGLTHPQLKIEGQGKHCVHIKFAEEAQIKARAVSEFLKQAAARAPK